MLKLEETKVMRGTFTLFADITISTGITAIIGPSGGGKSTLLDVVSGFVLPEEGRVIFDGRDVSALDPGDRPVTTLFQDNNLFPHLTALQNVALGLTTARKPSESSLNKAKMALSSVGLEGMHSRLPADLSGGQRARVALARAILSDRQVVCLDEPFSALGPALRTEMIELVSDRLGDRIVLMVTHDPEDALRVAPTTIFVDGGRAHTPMPTRAIFETPSPELASYLG